MYDLVCCNIVTLVKLCAFVGSLVGVVMITKCTYACGKVLNISAIGGILRDS